MLKIPSPVPMALGPQQEWLLNAQDQAYTLFPPTLEADGAVGRSLLGVGE